MRSVGKRHLSGIINVLKPPGMTSHDVVNRVRQLFQVKRVGHTGTLDPAAAGVLVLCLGEATKISRFLEAGEKVYWAEVFLGAVTDTYDGTGRIMAEDRSFLLPVETIREKLAIFRGAVWQVPPMYSAVKHQGRPLYKLARKGIEVERSPRQVYIHALELQAIIPAGAAAGTVGYGSRLRLLIRCSKGTYIRTLAHDLGQALGCGAYLAALLRLANGPFVIQDSLTLEELHQAQERGEETACLIEPAKALSSLLPTLECTPEEGERLRQGAKLPLSPHWQAMTAQVSSGEAVAVLSGGRLIGVARLLEEGGHWWLQPARMFRREDE